MQRLLGFLLIAVAVAGVVTQRVVGIHLYVNDAVQAIWGPYATGTPGSPVGEAVVYLVFYFIAMAGLALLATSKRGS